MAEDRERGQEGGGRQLFCRIITPQEMVFDDEVDLVIARIADGEIGVLADHAPLVSTLEIGDVRIRQGEERRVYATSDGFFKVSENLVQILVEEAVAAEDIDSSEAENRISQAEQEIADLPEDDERARSEAERRQRIADNLVRVARNYGEG